MNALCLVLNGENIALLTIVNDYRALFRSLRSCRLFYCRAERLFAKGFSKMGIGLRCVVHSV